MLLVGPQPTGVDGGMGGRESRVFPEQGKEELILSMGLTQDFLIYSTQVWKIFTCAFQCLILDSHWLIHKTQNESVVQYLWHILQSIAYRLTEEIFM